MESKKTNKKVIALILAIALLVIAAIGGTMAYFTDKDSAENTFTVGNVKIDLIEQQENEDGTALEDYTNPKVLNPIVGSAQGEKDALGQPTAKNYVDKIVTVKNTGKNDAYVRAYFAIPSALDDGYETFNPGLNVLHFNFGNYKDGTTLKSTFGNQWIWQPGKDGKDWKYYETKIDGVAYNVYYADYYKTLPAGKTTEQLLSGVYLDKNVDMKDGKYIDTRKPDADLSILEGEVKLPVMAVAVQADGFDSADAAVTAAFGANYDPFNAK